MDSRDHFGFSVLGLFASLSGCCVNGMSGTDYCIHSQFGHFLWGTPLIEAGYQRCRAEDELADAFPLSRVLAWPSAGKSDSNRIIRQLI